MSGGRSINDRDRLSQRPHGDALTPEYIMAAVLSSDCKPLQLPLRPLSLSLSLSLSFRPPPFSSLITLSAVCFLLPPLFPVFMHPFKHARTHTHSRVHTIHTHEHSHTCLCVSINFVRVCVTMTMFYLNRLPDVGHRHSSQTYCIPFLSGGRSLSSANIIDIHYSRSLLRELRQT